MVLHLGLPLLSPGVDTKLSLWCVASDQYSMVSWVLWLLVVLLQLLTLTIRMSKTSTQTLTHVCCTFFPGLFAVVYMQPLATHFTFLLVHLSWSGAKKANSCIYRLFNWSSSLPEYFSLRPQLYFWFLGFLKLEWEAELPVSSLD